MRTLRFHRYGLPLDVLDLDDVEPPTPGPGQVRLRVQACGLNPADWALCSGLFAGALPRGVGLEVSGVVDALGDGVSGLALGDLALGPVPFTGTSAGASDHAVLDTWFACPPGLDVVDAAALPMAVETANRALEQLGVEGGTTVLVHGAGSTVGFAAVQIAMRRGATVVATAGPTYADDLRQMGATVTDYGDGMADRVRSIVGGPVDLAFDAAPVSGALPDLVRTVSAPDHVLTVSDIGAAEKLGVRTSTGEGVTQRHEVIGEYVGLAATGAFRIPVAGEFALADWRTAVQRSLSGQAKGKLVLTMS